ncbi:MAG: RNA polymerase sigma factor [Candidatus Pacebacteria bacterium]|nr:RNA polymerase sigma factor [Candidatus Paceibacterota bacterium]
MNNTMFTTEDATIQEWPDEQVLTASMHNPDFFVHIVRRYEASFMRKARKVLYREEDVEDVVQEAFTKIYLHAGRFERVEGACFKSWAYTILMNTALTKYRKVMRDHGRTAELAPEHYENLPDDVHEESYKMELTDYVVSIFAKMPEHLSRVLTLHFIQDLPQQLIAEREQVSVGAIKTRVHRAKAEFRELAEQYSPY